MEDHHDMPDSAIQMMWIFLSIMIISAGAIIGMQYKEICELKLELKIRDQPQQPLFEVRKK